MSLITGQGWVVSLGKWKGFAVFDFADDGQPAIEERLAGDLSTLQAQHPRGFALRVKSVDNINAVSMWERQLAEFSALHLFGFTVRIGDGPLDLVTVEVVLRMWKRFSVQFENASIERVSVEEQAA